MAEQDASLGVALGIEFIFMGMTFTGDLQYHDGAARFIASAVGFDLRQLLKKNDVHLPEELKDLPNLVVDRLYLSLSLDKKNEIELFGSLHLEDVSPLASLHWKAPRSGFRGVLRPVPRPSGR